MRPPGTSAFRLHLKQAAAFRGALIALGVAVLIATIAITAWPRAVSTLLTEELQHRVAATSPVIRDVQAHARITGLSQDQAIDAGRGTVWQHMPEVLTRLHAGMPSPLASALTQGNYAARTDPYCVVVAGKTATNAGPCPAGPVYNYHYHVKIEVAPSLHSDAVLASGHWPAAFDPQYRSLRGTDMPGLITAMQPSDKPIEIALSADTATGMKWTLGETRTISLGSPGAPQKLTLVGTLGPKAANGDFWQLDTLRNEPALENLGDGGFKLTAVAWMNPKPWPKLQYSFTGSNITGWFGVNPQAFTGENVTQLQSQLGKFVSSPVPGAHYLHFDTRLDDTLNAYVAGAGPAQTLLLLLGAGPLGVTIAVLFLGVELLIERRRNTLALLSARGASALRIRASLAIEALAVSLPAAVIGLVVTVLVLPGSLDPTTAVLAACCALVPPATMAALGTPRTRSERAAAQPRGFSRWRWVVECVVIVAAVIALLLVYQRGLSSPTGTTQADPLLVLTPLLVSLAVSVVVLRIYPVLLSVVAGWLRRRRTATGFVGAVRAERTTASTLVPVLAVLVGVAITVFSCIIFSTERVGVDQAARGAVGADFSISDSSLTTAQIRQVREIDGVGQVVTISLDGYANLTKDGTSLAVSVLSADTAALAQLQQDLPPSVRTPQKMTKRQGAPAPMLLGGWDEGANARNGSLNAGEDTLRVRLASPTAVPGNFIKDSPWLLLDTDAVTPRLGLQKPVVVTALVGLAPGADAAAVSRALHKVAGRSGSVISAGDQVAAAKSAPVVGGLERMLAVAIVLGVLLCAFALLLSLVRNARNRTRLTATLRTLGFSRRQNAALTVWEVAPIVGAGLVGGLAAGFALPFVVLAPLNLAAFTGGTAHPAVVVDGVLIGLAVTGFVVVCAVATATALAIAERRNAATVLRTGEDE